MLFVRYSVDPGANYSIQFIQKAPEYYSNVFALFVCVHVMLSSASAASETHLDLSLTFLHCVVIAAPVGLSSRHAKASL